MRLTVEAYAATRALPYVSDVKIEKMSVIDNAMDKAVAENDLDSLTTLNQEFHRTLYTVNPDQVTMAVIESIWLQRGPFQRQVLELLKGFYKIDRHKQILAGLNSRDAAALVDATESDIRESSWRAGRKILTSSPSTA